jgi:hypothetical protein
LRVELLDFLYLLSLRSHPFYIYFDLDYII